MKKKEGFVHVRLDSDLVEHVQVIKERPGGVSRFVNDKIREDKNKQEKDR